VSPVEVGSTGGWYVALRHVNVVERLFGLSNRCATGDAEALAELVAAYHEDARLQGQTDASSPEAAIRAYFDRVHATYKEWQCMLDYVQDYGDRVLALGAVRDVQDGGLQRENAVGWIFDFRGDKIEAVQAYPSYGDALRAATTRPPAPDVNTP
jgi:ketosteroid isomerase-like protein